MRTLFAVGLLLVYASPVGAGSYAIMGTGAQTCGKFAADYKRDPRFVEDYNFAWAQGYMSGANVVLLTSKVGFRDLNHLTTDGQMSFIRAYCDQHPLAQFDLAVKALFETL